MKLRLRIRFLKFLLVSLAVLVSLVSRAASHFLESVNWLLIIMMILHSCKWWLHKIQSNKKASPGNLQDVRCICLLFTLRFCMRFQTRNNNLPKLTVHSLITDFVLNLARNIHRAWTWIGRGSLNFVSVLLKDSGKEVSVPQPEEMLT